MNWKGRLLLLVLIAVPAFSGYPLKHIDAPILAGVSWAWVGYLTAVHVLILLLLGSRHFSNVVSVASLITLPVIFVGGAVSYLIHLTGLGYPGGPPDYSAHYVVLCLTMLTVIPLALSMVAVIPFHEIEQRLLANPMGVSSVEKVFLMFLRVFNHIVHAVLPNILEVMREEKRFARPAGDSRVAGKGAGNQMPFRTRVRHLVDTMTRIGIEGICAALQYIPLWAVEISRLPQRKDGKK